jgi:hypothetical protein
MDPSTVQTNATGHDTNVAARTVAVLRSRVPPPYGYHNSFHTHASEASPPIYNVAKNAKPPTTHTLSEEPILPPYSCSIYKEAIVDIRCEFLDPFIESPDVRWRTQYAILQGTKLSLHSIKSIDTNFQIKLRRKIHSLSLQHGEVGLAVDIPDEEPLAKFPLIDLLPSNMRKRMVGTKPHLFEPTREWILRLRLEGCQFLLAFQSQEVMLDWVEDICAAIDISQPIDERSYPRYRSLPRRSRRQRQLENSYRSDFPMDGLESLGERLVQQQQRIISALYPNLASEAEENTNTASGAQRQNGHDLEHVGSQDPDMDDLDPADIRESPYLYNETSSQENSGSTTGRPSNQRLDHGTGPHNQQQRTFNPKSYTRIITVCPTAALRYRRRCAPIMNKYSPRSSDIIFCRGKRMRIDNKKERLIPFEIAPPRYPRSANGKGGANAAKPPRSGESAFGEPFLTARSWRNPQASAATTTGASPGATASAEDGEGEADGAAACRTTSRSSTRPSDEDVASVHSDAGMTIRSGAGTGDSIEPVSTNGLELLSQQSSQVSSEGVMGAGNDSSLTPLKEKTGQIGRKRRMRPAEEESAHAFAGLVL